MISGLFLCVLSLQCSSVGFLGKPILVKGNDIFLVGCLLLLSSVGVLILRARISTASK